MDRYHMSESARITSATRRRSLSSGNLSTSDKEQQHSTNSILRSKNARNASYVHNGAGSSPRGPHHLAPATTYYDESKVEGGALRKFLSRTKSLIWRRPSNAGDQYQQNGNDSIRLQRPQHALESISCADTASELWGSHSSIVEMSEFEMKELSTSSTLLADRSGKSEMGESMAAKTDMDSSPTGTLTSENDYYANGKIKHQLSRDAMRNKMSSEPASSGGPTLPPRNDRSSKNSMQMSPGTSSTTSNMSIPLPKEADNSCLVVSDHMRPKKSSPPVDYGTTGIRREQRRSHKENDIESIQQQQQRSVKSRHRRQEDHEESFRNATLDQVSSGQHSKTVVSRVESFAVSEAPIIPESSNFSRRSAAQNDSGSNKNTQRSRGTMTKESDGEIRGRRRLWNNHVNHDDDDLSDTEHNVGAERDGDSENEDDDATIDFNDHDEYDEEAVCSVFMEAEQEQMTTTSKSQKPKESKKHSSPHRLHCQSTGSKRSKSSDITVRTTDTRRSRSTSSKAAGMDTVDMPKRHGGFIREKTSRNQSASGNVAAKGSKMNGHSYRSSGSGTRSTSSPSSRREPSKESTRKNNGLTYKGRPIGSPPPIPAPQPTLRSTVQQPSQPPPPPPPMTQYPHQPSSGHRVLSAEKKLPEKIPADCSTVEELTEVEPDYGTIKGSPTPPRKEEIPHPQHHKHIITMKQSIVPYTKHQSLIIRDGGERKAAPRGGAAWKGSIRSEIHTVELITTTDVRGEKPVLDYGSFIRRRLYYPERGSKIDQKSERSGNYCGPWLA